MDSRSTHQFWCKCTTVPDGLAVHHNCAGLPWLYVLCCPNKAKVLDGRWSTFSSLSWITRLYSIKGFDCHFLSVATLYRVVTWGTWCHQLMWSPQVGSYRLDSQGKMPGSKKVGVVVFMAMMFKCLTDKVCRQWSSRDWTIGNCV